MPMLPRRSHPSATQSTTRLEAFTDGVFAIAATLLVLDLTSHSIGQVATDADLIAALGGMGELFFNFVLSFALLCLLWMTHVQQFEHFVRVDAVVTWLNSVRLLFIVFVPFATGLMTEYQQFLIGRIAMPLTFFLAVLVSYLQWLWATRFGDTMIPDVGRERAAALARGALSALIISALVVVAAVFVGSAAFLLFLLDPLVTRLLRGAGG